MIFHSQFHLPVFKCALVKPIGLLSQQAAGEMALNGFRGVRVCVCDCEKNRSCFSMCLIVLFVAVHLCVACVELCV